MDNVIGTVLFVDALGLFIVLGYFWWLFLFRRILYLD